jgi:superfamily II DNA or RNA helicase
MTAPTGTEPTTQETDLAGEVAAASAWCGESLLHGGESPAVALAEGTARRAALEAALQEMAEGRASPSPEFRRRFSLMLGLERILSEDTPGLASGLTLRPHQVDALAGMLAALIADLERGAEDEDEPNGELTEANGDLAEANGELMELPNGDEEEPEPPAPADPGARRRYRFKHPTASGKTVAAAGFVEACRTVGVLILTHRRLLVDQFLRDLKEQGYGARLRSAVERGRRIPEPPPVTVETYAWFIKHADSIDPDAYGVVICDEAHTALGERTSATIRRFSRPTYVGMTATDQLLQKHVGDVFPAEIADFPLADAVKRGVVAPLRCLRVRPGASLRNVPVVGGDYDQKLLAEALDHEALNMAAAMYYADRFGDRAGIVYAAGVDHAERVAQAMRAAGIKARAVSGRTPPRVLAETLAAYERGEMNVLVNAQLLAEGWNAPRATICMHLAPTASRRVYQQRVGRIMRLHRRKEAGVVVDLADPGATHSDRTVTLHSLLDADVYRPGALVTPRPPRRRQRWRRQAKPVVREADWLIPVTDDVARREAVILQDWKVVAADRLPPDEQEIWAQVAARKVSPNDLPRLTETLTKVDEGTRVAFFATCAAECKHRTLRLAALGDLASRRPDSNTVDRVVRLIEGAPTWAADRAQGARILLLALGEGGFPGSLSQRLGWTWRLARAARDAQYRVATTLPNGRELVRGLAGSRGEEHHMRAKLLVMAATQAEFEVGAALLAAASPQDALASRTIEAARSDLGRDPERLATALANNIPAQVQREARTKAKRKRHRARRATRAAAPEGAVIEEQAEGTAAEGQAAGAEAPEGVGTEAPSKAKRRRRRRRRRREAVDAAPPAAGDEGAAQGPGDAPAAAPDAAA